MPLVISKLNVSIFQLQVMLLIVVLFNLNDLLNYNDPCCWWVIISQFNLTFSSNISNIVGHLSFQSRHFSQAMLLIILQPIQSFVRVYRRLKEFFNKHDVFYQSLYGFRDNRSTEHAVLDIANKIQANMEKGMFSCGFFIDLKKAFDTVDHSILLEKRNCYGTWGTVNDWFSSYLHGRVQTIQLAPLYPKKKTHYVVSHRVVC